MREIKFRAWDEERSRFMPTHIMMNNLCSDDEDRVICGTYRENGDWYEPKLMQYTGLKDKNGVEIYEFMEIDRLYEVQFKDGCYVLLNISNNDIILLSKYMEKKNGQIEITKEYTKI